MQKNTHALSAPAAPWYRHRWPWFIMLGPLAVMLATAVTVTLALRQPVAMVVDDYYKQGKAINQDLRRDRSASNLQLALTLDYDAAHTRITGQLRSFDKPMQAPFQIQLAHPTQPHKDLKLAATPDAQGKFAVSVPALAATHWQVVVEDAGQVWRLASGWRPWQQASLHIAADR